MTQKYDRFKDAPWFQQGIRPSVLVGGAGGIGSWLTVLLNRAGFETFVYDHDTLEAINMAGQLYMHKSIGQTKVDALAEIVKEICQDDIVPNFVKMDEHTMSNDIVFSAFDNMKARKDMFNSWAANNDISSKAIFIDGRLTAEQLTIFCVQRGDLKAIEEYATQHLFDDSEVPDLPCTMAQTSHGAAMIAAHMTEFFTNWYSIILGKDPSRNVPFFWEYMIPIGFMSTREAINAERLNRDPIWIGNDIKEDAGDFTVITIPNPEDEEDIETEDDQVLGETKETDLTLEEIKEIDGYLNERHQVTTTEAKEFDDLITEGIDLMSPSVARPATTEEIDQINDFLEQKGIPNPASPNQPGNSSDSLDFEEEDNLDDIDDDSTDPSINDLPF